MCNINLFRSYYIISARSMCVFQLKMSKFRVRFDSLLLYEMCLSIGVWMPTKIYLYTYYYIPFLIDQSFHHWQKLCKSNLRAISVSTSNMCQSSNCMHTTVTSYCLTLNGRTIIVKAHSFANNTIYVEKYNLLNWYCFYSFMTIITLFL
jgi:hypothetical protein